jgi:hypothetical protein
MSRSSLRNGSKRVQQFVTSGNFLDNSRKVLFSDCGSAAKKPVAENPVLGPILLGPLRRSNR